jgi:hypothetical protein
LRAEVRLLEDYDIFFVQKSQKIGVSGPDRSVVAAYSCGYECLKIKRLDWKAKLTSDEAVRLAAKELNEELENTLAFRERDG